MLVTSEELRFDFKGAKFDLTRSADERLLSWIFSQFLYGEVTGNSMRSGFIVRPISVRRPFLPSRRPKNCLTSGNSSEFFPSWVRNPKPPIGR